MNTDKKHSAPDDFFNKVEVPYSKSKEEVWEMLSARLDEQPQPQTRTVSMFTGKLWWSLAAAVLLLAGLFGVMRFYTVTVENPGSQLLTATLPDGSTVELNASSTLSYQPLWWRFSRQLQFEGEGFFEVEKGKAFTVSSALGKTVVLGTSFNIFSRENEYKVSCITGKVKVVSKAKEEVILSPGYHAEVSGSGSIKIFKNYPVSEVISWREGMFNFTSAPLEEVIREIERQYAVNIRLNTQTNYFYTGFFSKNKPVEQVLDLISKTFGLTVTKAGDGSFRIDEEPATP